MKILFYFFLISTISWGGYRLVAKFEAHRAYLGHLKNTAETNSISIASAELEKALKEIEKRGLTSGYTSTMWVTPNDNLDLWYKDLKALHNEISVFPKNSSTKEKTKMLIKLKKALIDESKEKGDNISFPKGIYLYPHNKIVALWGAISIIFTIFFFLLSAKKFSWYKE